MSLSRQEQETIILFNEAEDTATVDTCNPALTRKLDKLITCHKTRTLVKEREDEYSARYTIPKRWVRIQPPPTYTGEQRAEMQARGREAAQKLNATKGEAPNAAAGEHEA